MKDKYPAFFQLLVLIGKVIKDGEGALKPGESLFQRLLAFEDLAPSVIAFLPLASQLSAEIGNFKIEDYEAALAQFASELDFLPAKANAIIQKAFPIVDEIVVLIPKIEALLAAFKA